ncbi:MAG: hypothetical protein AAGA85_09065 [Bacteroidota bacterium]
MRFILFLLIAPSLAMAQSAPDSLKQSATSRLYIGLGIGTSIDKTTTDEAQSLSAQAVVGWDFHPWVGAGVGLGIHDSFFNFEQFQYMPLFGQLRAKTPGKVGLVAFLNSGYAFSLRKDEGDEFFRREFDGGWLWHFGGGFRFRIRESDLHLTLNHRSFESSLKNVNIWQGEVTSEWEERRRFNRIEIMLALEI